MLLLVVDSVHCSDVGLDSGQSDHVLDDLCVALLPQLVSRWPLPCRTLGLVVHEILNLFLQVVDLFVFALELCLELAVFLLKEFEFSVFVFDLLFKGLHLAVL